MRKRFIIILLVLAVVVGGIAVALSGRPVAVPPIDQMEPVTRQARIHPDYSGSVIPPNIAPLNFAIDEPGVAFCVQVSGSEGSPIEVACRDGVVTLSPKRWRSLLEANRGQTLRVDVCVKTAEGRWQRFEPIENLVAQEDIDGYVVYRKMHLTHVRMNSRIDVCRRDLGTFDESVVLSSTEYEDGCLNCHSFCQNRGDKMLLGVRSQKYGTATLLAEGGEVRRLDTKFGYTSWHPSGRLAVYAVNKIPMFYHAARNEVRDTVNLDSMLSVYYCNGQRIRSEPKLAQKDRLENWPAWSGDGKYLYFCTTPKLWPDQTSTPPPLYDRVKYDLVRIPYDVETDTWGEIEMVLSAQQTGKSIGMPRVSSDGRWLSFCLFDYGYFPSWKQESDLYLMDLQAPLQDGHLPYRRLDINSDKSESWQTWSSNSRWLLFSSKRLHGVFTRLFISYIDSEGNAHKPFVLPQKDPDFYGSCLRAFNTPELVVDPPQATGEALARVYRRGHGTAVSIPATMATPTARPAAPTASWELQHE